MPMICNWLIYFPHIAIGYNWIISDPKPRLWSDPLKIIARLLIFSLVYICLISSFHSWPSKSLSKMHSIAWNAHVFLRILTYCSALCSIQVIDCIKLDIYLLSNALAIHLARLKQFVEKQILHMYINRTKKNEGWEGKTREE